MEKGRSKPNPMQTGAVGCVDNCCFHTLIFTPSSNSMNAFSTHSSKHVCFLRGDEVSWLIVVFWV